MFDVNVVGIVRVTRAALPYLRASANAVVVNTCSIAATAGLPNRALYSATKGAVQSLTLAMAADHLRRGHPGELCQPGHRRHPLGGPVAGLGHRPGRRAAGARGPPAHGRLVTAEEVAAAIAYLASPLAGVTTGTVLAVDGGMHGLRLPNPPSP